MDEVTCIGPGATRQVEPLTSGLKANEFDS